MTIDPRPFTGTQRAVNETAARYCRRVRRCWTSADYVALCKMIQSSPPAKQGFPGARGLRERNADKDPRNPRRGSDGDGKGLRENAAARFRKFGHAV